MMQINPFNSQGNQDLGGVHQKSVAYMRKEYDFTFPSTWLYYISAFHFKSYKQGMQNKILFMLLDQKTHTGITAILQEQNIISCLKDLRP